MQSGFYHRQFVTRKVSNHQILGRLDDVLNDYLNSDALAKQCLPTVGYIAEKLRACSNFIGEIYYAVIFERNEADLFGIAGTMAKKPNEVAAQNRHKTISE